MYRCEVVEAGGCLSGLVLLGEQQCFLSALLAVTAVVQGERRVVIGVEEERARERIQYRTQASDWVKEEWRDRDVGFSRRYCCDSRLGRAGEGGARVRTFSAGCRYCRDWRVLFLDPHSSPTERARTVAKIGMVAEQDTSEL